MYIIGIDVGGMSIKGGIITREGDILYKATLPTSTYDEEHSISEDIHQVISHLLELSNITLDQIAGIGIGQPGSVDSKKGIIRYSNNIPLTNVPVVNQLKAYYNLPIYINNDANCAALGEYLYGAGRQFNDIVLVTLGTGVGSGIIIDGTLFEGKECAGAETGHTVIEINGNPCNCGRRGCWETYASASALIKQTKQAIADYPDSLMAKEAERNDGIVDGRTSFNAARAGDTAGRLVVDTYVNYVGIGLINLANTFRPDAIIIGGGISYEGDYLTAPLQKMLDEYTYGTTFNPRVQVISAKLANTAGILGAAGLVLKGNALK